MAWILKTRDWLAEGGQVWLVLGRASVSSRKMDTENSINEILQRRINGTLVKTAG